MGQRLGRRCLLAILPLPILLGVVGCTQDDGSPSDGSPSLDHLMGFTVERRDQVVAEADRIAVECMAEAGFKYVPLARDPSLDGVPRGFLDVGTVDSLIEFRRESGYGGAQTLTVLLDTLEVSRAAFDHANYLDGLSPEQNERYWTLLDPANEDGCATNRAGADLLVQSPSGGQAGTELASLYAELRETSGFLALVEEVGDCTAKGADLPVAFDQLEAHFLKEAVETVGGSWDDSDPDGVSWEISTESLAAKYTPEQVRAISDELRVEELKISRVEAECWEGVYVKVAEMEYEATGEWRSEYSDELSYIITALGGEQM